MRKRDADYYRMREQVELDRAQRASHSSARRAHLGLAALYRRELERLHGAEPDPVTFHFPREGWPDGSARSAPAPSVRMMSQRDRRKHRAGGKGTGGTPEV